MNCHFWFTKQIILKRIEYIHVDMSTVAVLVFCRWRNSHCNASKSKLFEHLKTKLAERKAREEAGGSTNQGEQSCRQGKETNRNMMDELWHLKGCSEKGRSWPDLSTWEKSLGSLTRFDGDCWWWNHSWPTTHNSLTLRRTKVPSVSWKSPTLPLPVLLQPW